MIIIYGQLHCDYFYCNIMAHTYPELLCYNYSIVSFVLLYLVITVVHQMLKEMESTGTPSNRIVLGNI